MVANDSYQTEMFDRQDQIIAAREAERAEIEAERARIEEENRLAEEERLRVEAELERQR
jgi:hypothetical protein